MTRTELDAIICRHCRDTIFFPREVLPG